MFDMLKIMKQVGEMQTKMQAAQEALGGIVVTGQSGGGLVVVTMTGRAEMTAIRIDPSLVQATEKDMLEDLIVAATKDAQHKAGEAAKAKMADVTAGMPIPPGLLSGLKL